MKQKQLFKNVTQTNQTKNVQSKKVALKNALFTSAKTLASLGVEYVSADDQKRPFLTGTRRKGGRNHSGKITCYHRGGGAKRRSLRSCILPSLDSAVVPAIAIPRGNTFLNHSLSGSLSGGGFGLEKGRYVSLGAWGVVSSITVVPDHNVRRATVDWVEEIRLEATSLNEQKNAFKKPL